MAFEQSVRCDSLLRGVSVCQAEWRNLIMEGSVGKEEMDDLRQTLEDTAMLVLNTIVTIRHKVQTCQGQHK